MPGNFSGGSFSGAVGGFSVDSTVTSGKTGTGGIDPGRGSFKPTGILHRPKKEGRREVADRVDDSRSIQAEIAGRLAREFSEETSEIEARPPVVEMSLQEINAEIGVLIRKKLRTEEDELLLLLLVASS